MTAKTAPNANEPTSPINTSAWSKDPSTQVGAVTVGSKKEVLSQGFNGFPRNINDTDERYNNRATKYKFVVHAEMNATFESLTLSFQLSSSLDFSTTTFLMPT
jgi:deoxycytidylate deaminase